MRKLLTLVTSAVLGLALVPGAYALNSLPTRSATASPQSDLTQEKNAETALRTLAPGHFRISGSDRFATNLELARLSNSRPGGVVYITQAPAGIDGALAAVQSAHNTSPLLLIPQQGIDENTRKVLNTLRPKHIVLVGSFNKDLHKRLSAFAPVTTVQGRDRIETAADLALGNHSAIKGNATVTDSFTAGSTVAPNKNTKKVLKVYLVADQADSDILLASGVAGREKSPLLLTKGNVLSPATQHALAKLRPGTVEAIGGIKVLSDSVLRQAAKISGSKISRVAGNNRYDTSAILASRNHSPIVFYANGNATPDAFSAVPLAAKRQANILITQRSCATRSIRNVEKQLNTKQHYLIGGPAVLTKAVLHQVCKIKHPKQAAPKPAPKPIPQPSHRPTTPQEIAFSLFGQYGWSDNQRLCLVNLWNRESGWRTNAGRANGPYGIPQANPGYKMSVAGSDWATNPATQIKWGLGYIAGRYGNPCKAWGHWRARHWY